MSGTADRLLSAALVLLISGCTSAPPPTPDASASVPTSTGAPSTTIDPGASPTDAAAPPTGATDGPTVVPPSVPGETEPPLGDIGLAYGEPQPVDVSVSLSPITFTTPVTTENGGFVTLAGTDGTFYQLEIPAQAVLSDLDVTVTVVSSISGSPLGDTLVGAVDLEPSGLVLMKPAILTMVPSTPVSLDQEGPFTADSDGGDFHLHPLDVQPSGIRMPILHFSIFGLFKTDAERRADMIRKTAASVQKQVEQELSRLTDEARKNEGNIDLEEAEAVLNYYRDRVVRPLLALAEHDHRLFLEAFETWTAWERNRGLLLGEQDFDPALLASARRAFANYVEHTKERCYAHDFGSIYDLMGLVKQDQLLGGLLGGLEQSDAFEFIDKCSTFTLEMDSTMDVDLNTCMFIDAGHSELTETSHVSTAVEIRYSQGGPWSGPMQWLADTYQADCHLPVRGGGDVFECQMRFAGFADAGEFAVVALDLDFNNVNRPPPPPPPAPPVPGATPSPSAPPTPSRPPTPQPTARPEETITELRFRGVLVQPGDPQIFTDGNCTLFETWNDSNTSRASSGWLAGWKDNSAPVGRPFLNHPVFGEVYRLVGWEHVLEADVLAELVYDDGTSGVFGTTDEETRFVLRHTPRR